MSVLEKALIGVSMVAIGGYGGYYLIKTKNLTSDKSINIQYLLISQLTL